MAIAMPSNPAAPESFVNDFRSVLTKDVSGGPTVTLTDVEAAKRVHKYTGTLTQNVEVIVPTEENFFGVWNATSGAFTLTVKTTGGTGVAVTQGKKVELICDGTDVIAWTAEL
jgi:hypothetical protein